MPPAGNDAIRPRLGRNASFEDAHPEQDVGREEAVWVIQRAEEQVRTRLPVLLAGELPEPRSRRRRPGLWMEPPFVLDGSGIVSPGQLAIAEVATIGIEARFRRRIGSWWRTR